MMKNLSLSTVYSYLTSFKLCVILLLYGGNISAQYDLLYENHEQNQVRWVRAIADDGQGNTYLAGKFAVSLTLGAFTLTNTGVNEPAGNGQTGFVGKFNSTSNTWLWAKKITLQNGSGQQTWVTSSDIMDMTTDNAGNVYITGIYSGVVSFDNVTLSSTKQGSQHTPDIFVAKYNTNGSIVWAKSFGSKAGLDMGKAIALDGSDNIYIGGIFTNKTINCGAPFSTNYLYDVYLAKLNNAGSALWQKRYPNSNPTCTDAHKNQGNALSVDESGNAFLAGQFSGTVSFGTGSGLTISSVNGTVDVFAAKINGSGTTQWVNSAGSSSSDAGETIYADASGNVFTGGRIGTDAFLNKFNSTGGPEWSVNPFPVSTEWQTTSISRIIPYSGSLLVNSSAIGFKTISPADGSVISSDSLVGNIPGNASITDVAIAGSGYVFNVMGQCGTVTIGNTLLASFNECPYSGISRDIFIVRSSSGAPLPFNQDIDIIDPIAISPQIAENEIEVYPNPASDIIHVNIPDSENEITLFIQNQFGRMVWSEKFESHRRTATISLDRQNFHSGIYYLVCLSNDEVLTKQLVIDRE